MKKLFFLCFVQFVFSQNLSPDEKFVVSQNYIYLANFELHKKNYKKSSLLFKKAFQYHKALNSYNLLDAAACALYNGENKLSEKYIIDAIVDFKAPLDFIMNYDKFKNFTINNSFFENLPRNYDTYYKCFYTRRNNLQAYLDATMLVERDQVIRNVIHDLHMFNEENKSIKQRIFNQMNKIDEENIRDLIEITKGHGYQDVTWLILWHQRLTYKDENNSFWQFFKNILQEEIKLGNLHKSFFVIFEDFSEMTFRQKQKYGVFPQNYEMNPIEDINNIDEIRGNVGLPPLSYEIIVNGYLKPEGYEYSEGQLRKQLEQKLLKYEKIKN